MSTIGLLNVIFYTKIEPLFSITEATVIILVGFVLMFVGRKHLPAVITNLFTSDDHDTD